MTGYFVVDRADLTQDMLDKSLPRECNNPYCRRVSTDGEKILLKYSCEDVPAELFSKYYEPMTEAQMLEHISDVDNGFLEDDTNVVA